MNNKLLSRIPEEQDFPSVVLIDTISYCNLKCSMCPHKHMRRKPGIMSWELYKKIIDEIAVKNPEAQIWITFFGEGLILKDLPEKIRYAKDRGLKHIDFNSNGNLLNPENSRQLIESGLNRLLVGIDAFDPETYAKNRVGGKIERVVQGVLEYHRLLKEIGRNDQSVCVQFVEMENNRAEMERFVDFWNSHGVSVKVRPMISWAGQVEAANLTSGVQRLPCYWAMNTINITDTGKVAMCSVDLECDVPMGDINTQTIEDVWKSALLKFREQHRKGEWDDLPEKCRNCLDWQSGYADYKIAEETP